MIAIDTNVIIRLLVRDDARQYDAALRLLAENNVLIGSSVLVECEWVLRRLYRLSEMQISSAFAGLAGLPGVRIADRLDMIRLLDAYRQGFDFADALHVLVAEGQDVLAFATFDKALVRKAGRMDWAMRLEALATD